MARRKYAARSAAAARGEATRALLYVRVSTGDQAKEGLSLPAQLRACQRYAASLEWVIEDEYRDVQTGKRDDRKDYQRLLRDVQRLRAERRPVAVVVPWLHRFGRNMLERVRSQKELTELGVPIHSVHEGGRLPEFVCNVLASLAQEESSQTSDRVSRTIADLHEQGWMHTCRAPWGLRWRPATAEERAAGSPKSVLEKNPKEAKYAAQAFERIANGATVRDTSRWIALLPDEARGGRRFWHSTLRFLLESPLYVGRAPSEDDTGPLDVIRRKKGRWPTLVSDATWLEVQRRLETNRSLPRMASNRHLLTGFARCPVEGCGGRMVGEKSASIGFGRYRCTSRQAGGEGAARNCTATAQLPVTDALVLDGVGRVLDAFAPSDPQLLADLRHEWAALHKPAGDAGDVTRRIKRLEADAARCERELVGLTRKFARDELSKAEYDAAKASTEDEQRSTTQQLEALRAEQGHVRPAVAALSLDETLRRVGGWAKALRRGDVQTQRDVLAELIEHVIPHRLGQKRFRVEIAWTPTGQVLAEVADAVAPRASE